MNEGERLRDLLDGSMDPSELESYSEYYKLAERIYGREALDEMGISTPEEAEGDFSQNGNSEFTHDVILPSPKMDSNVEEKIFSENKPKRRLFLTIIGVIGLLLVSSNIVVGIDSIIPFDLCEDTKAPRDIEFIQTESVNGNLLTIHWSVKNSTINQNYTVTWDISQNGSRELVDSGNHTWLSNGNVLMHLKTVTVQTEPYSWSSQLLDENLTIISTASGDYSSSVVATMSIIETNKKCEDNPKLKLGEIMHYENLNSWTQTGNGDMLDGMLIMTLSFISLLGLRKKKND